LKRTISVAPMMDCTDRHDRYLLRLISRHVLLYSEMIPVGTLIYGDRDRCLACDPFEQPLALQIGGSDPVQMAQCARFGEDYGYKEINMNVGCPSKRVQSGRFGACLMVQPELVAECIGAMRQAVRVPVTVKCRIGVDDHDSFEALCGFVEKVSNAGCGIFIIHARKAWLNGVSPRQNRRLPPLRHETVYALKRQFPHLMIIINGGVTNLDSAEQHLKSVDGVMIGRGAYDNPYLLADVDRRFYNDQGPVASRASILEHYIDYCERQLAAGCRLPRLARHVLGLFHGQPRAKAWRRSLTEYMHHPNAGVGVIREAAREVLSVAS